MRKKLSDLLLRFRNLVVEYGVIALIVHYVIFGLVIVGFWAAMRAGWNSDGAAGNAATWGAAYLATKAVQPIRILATLGVTPFIARIYEKTTGRSARLVAPSPPSPPGPESREPRAS